MEWECGSPYAGNCCPWDSRTALQGSSIHVCTGSLCEYSTANSLYTTGGIWHVFIHIWVKSTLTWLKYIDFGHLFPIVTFTGTWYSFNGTFCDTGRWEPSHSCHMVRISMATAWQASNGDVISKITGPYIGVSSHVSLVMHSVFTQTRLHLSWPVRQGGSWYNGFYCFQGLQAAPGTGHFQLITSIGWTRRGNPSMIEHMPATQRNTPHSNTVWLSLYGNTSC